ncbi:MAG: sn-glycerol-3-phosphate ABC transporter substrate-binding protein UgpB [Betaproteobacteria bacterium]|nr:sn-glycerol-3-phosphate ABC transporter substrate-binding protein UgpB [Betaproteobacteria bacterium]
MRRSLVSIILAVFCGAAQAQQPVQFWHAMGGALGGELDALVQRFNDAQKDFRILAEHKGSYEDVMIGALAAQRAGSGPHLVQVYEVGTAHMMAAKGSVRPLAQLLAENGERIEAKSFLPAVAGYFSDAAGQLLALPFNISTPILFYNKDAFRKAGLDPQKAPQTWYEMPKAMGALVESGVECVYTTVWPSWVQIENMSTWHNQDFATRENGLAGLDAKLIFNTHLMVRHVSMLASWERSGYFTYSGRRIEGERRFAKGECAMVTAASSSYADLRREAKFDFGVAQLPYYDDIRGAPHHSLIGGAGLWVLAGKQNAEYRGVAKFLAWLAQPEVQAEWHQRTGYVPVTWAAYELTAQKGFYKDHPGHEIAIRQLLLNRPTRESRGIRLGDFQDIRLILEEELEAVWDGKVAPKVALDRAAERGDLILRRFEREQRAGVEPAVPQRVPRAPAGVPRGAKPAQKAK